MGVPKWHSQVCQNVPLSLTCLAASGLGVQKSKGNWTARGRQDLPVDSEAHVIVNARRPPSPTGESREGGTPLVDSRARHKIPTAGGIKRLHECPAKDTVRKRHHFFPA